MDKSAYKNQFRKHCLKVLQKASKNNAYVKDHAIRTLLYAYIQAQNAQSMMLYLPLKTEVNLYPLILKLRREKKTTLCAFYGR
ncbi:MAG: 5-formyltetrahydrofolate cyclo-ligase [Sulfurovum sp.]|nr:5-formyltetrahydrofolate cyclo-ligase [Sulfurovum sp.]